MKIRNHKIIKTIALAILFGAAFLPAAVLADEPTWGDERDTYTMAHPAEYAVFNSITDNPTLGDERKFVRVAHIPSNCDKDKVAVEGEAKTGECVLEFKQSVEVEPGEQYMVYIYYHNNASSTFNTSAYNVRGVAKNTRMRSSYPELILGQRGEIEASINWVKKHKNSDDTWSWDEEESSVWAKAYLTNTDKEQIALSYVAGSGRHYNVGWMSESGKVLPLAEGHENEPMVVDKRNIADSIFTDTGIYLGFADGINGNAATGFGSGYVYGCEPYHGIVTYVLQAAKYEGEVNKTVSVDNGVTYKESVTIEPGAEVTFLVEVNNIGQKELTHVILNDSLPEGLTLVPGSVELSKKGSTTWDKQTDSSEYNLGTIGSGQTVYIRYKAKAGTDFDCTGKEITNTAKITYDGITAAGITDEDQASVTVRKTGDECTQITKASVKKEVSVNDGKTYKDKAEILPGETATFKITVKNVGDLYVGHIAVDDKLPEGLTLVEGSATIARFGENVADSGKATALESLEVSIEVLAPEEYVEIVYKVKAGENFDCKGKELTNTAKITYKGDDKNTEETSDVKVTVKKADEECTEPEPEKTCKTNPEMEECKKIPDTGPLEIAMFAMIVTGITGGTIYLILAKRSLKKMTAGVMEGTADPIDNGTDGQDKTDGGALNA
ncbi:DUF11 domain-containing protein [Candidatus Saccharibacteria bacterium]|nr:DUF11 domain-containing protein [Candidatus Saccharibacteria bacterium]